jgi:transposase-like protein
MAERKEQEMSESKNQTKIGLTPEERDKRKKRRARRWTPERRRDAVVMVMLEKQHPKVVASEFHTSVQTVKNWVRKYEKEVLYDDVVKLNKGLRERIERLERENHELLLFKKTFLEMHSRAS